VKNHRIGRMAVKDHEDLVCKVRFKLRSLSRTPSKIVGFFRKPSLCYAM
jgi:hypothetical protein